MTVTDGGTGVAVATVPEMVAGRPVTTASMPLVGAWAPTLTGLAVAWAVAAGYHMSWKPWAVKCRK